MLPGVQIQFSAKNCKITPTWKLAPPPQENAGSATVISHISTRIFRDFINSQFEIGSRAIFGILPSSKRPHPLADPYASPKSLSGLQAAVTFS